MPTNYSDQFYQMDPANPPGAGTLLTVSVNILTDENDDDDIDQFDNDALNGVDITASWPDDTVTVNVAGVGEVTYVGTTFYLSDGTRFFTPTDGQVLLEGTFVRSTFVTTTGPLPVGNLGPPCFTRGTWIATPGGDVLIEDLSVGDLVLTADHGPQPIRWIGTRHIDRHLLAAFPNLRPIVIEPGALGASLPSRRLTVSQQHRIVVRSTIAERMFGGSEVMVAAKHLTQMPGISLAEADAEVHYYHLLFDRHEVVTSNGAPTESLFCGPMAFKSLDRAALAELYTIFPELCAAAGPTEPARDFVPGRRGRKLAERHAKNGKELVSGLN